MAMKGLSAVWRHICPDALTSYALYVAPCSVPVLAVDPEYPHSVSAWISYGASFCICSGGRTPAKKTTVPYQHLSPCCVHMAPSVGIGQ